MDDWLIQARDRLAAGVGEDPATLDLTQHEIDELLELARAPLLCYLVGLVHARHGGDLADHVDAAIGKSS